MPKQQTAAERTTVEHKLRKQAANGCGNNAETSCKWLRKQAANGCGNKLQKMEKNTAAEVKNCGKPAKKQKLQKLKKTAKTKPTTARVSKNSCGRQKKEKKTFRNGFKTTAAEKDCGWWLRKNCGKRLRKKKQLLKFKY